MHAHTHMHTNAHTTHYTVCSGFYVEMGFWGKMVKGKAFPPQENVSVPLSKHLYLSVFTSRQELSQCHYLKLQLGNILGAAKRTYLKPNPLCHSSHLPQELCSVLLLQLKEIPEEKGGPGGRQDKITITTTYNSNCTPQAKGDSRQQQSWACNMYSNTEQLTFTQRFTNYNVYRVRLPNKMAGQLWQCLLRPTE